MNDNFKTNLLLLFIFFGGGAISKNITLTIFHYKILAILQSPNMHITLLLFLSRVEKLHGAVLKHYIDYIFLLHNKM